MSDTGQQRDSGKRQTKGRRGQSMVELAVALPLLLLILLGTIDLGQVFFAYIDLRNGVREGASYGSRFPSDTTAIQNHVITHSPGLATGTTVTVVCNGDCTAKGGTGLLTVTATRQFQPITTSFLGSFGVGPFTISSSASARVLS